MKFKIIFLSLIMFLCFGVQGAVYHVATTIACLDSNDLFVADVSNKINISVGDHNIDSENRGSLACGDGKYLSFDVMPKENDSQLSQALSDAVSNSSKLTVDIRDTDDESKHKEDSNSTVSKVLQ